MSDDTGSTIVSKELEGVLENESSQELPELPTVEVIVDYSDAQVRFCSDIMMMDETSVTLVNVPTFEAVSLLYNKRKDALEKVVLATGSKVFEFKKPIVSISVTDSSTSLVSLTQSSNE